MMPARTPSALSLKSVSHAFGDRQALEDVGFSIEPSEFCVLLGLNGAGKTTLFAHITRLYESASGEISVLGHDVRRQATQALAQLGVVFQQRTLDLDLTVNQNLLYHGALHGFPRSEAKRRAQEELERAGLAERAQEKVRRLSGGLIRRVEITRALLHRPRLLLLDEPTVGLDIRARQEILDHVRRLCTEEGLAVLWATHLIDEASKGDHVVVLHEGRVLVADRVSAVLEATGTADLTRAFATLTGPSTTNNETSVP